MSFFDELGKKISQVGQNAVQKTKDFSDITKLNSSISAEERKINGAIVRLGKAYYEIHSEDYETVFEPIILEIKEAQNNIEGLRQQIQEIKKVSRCEKCGAEVPNNAAFCSSCGAQVYRKNEYAPAGEIVCSGCGQVVPAECNFCVVCGTPVNSQPVAAAEPQQPVQYTEQEANMGHVDYVDNREEQIPQVPAETINPSEGDVEIPQEITYATPQMPGNKVCPNCNAEILPDMVFCTNCGIRVEN